MNEFPAQNIIGREKPLLSICIPTYNRSDELKKCINSFLASRSSLIEIVVSDDGSADSTSELLDEINDVRMKTVRSKINRGRATALYHAVLSSRGKFVMLFDDDDIFYPDVLEEILQDCGESEHADNVVIVYNMRSNLVLSRAEIKERMNSNWIKMRADLEIRGDKKEVVNGDLLRASFKKYVNLIHDNRRIPTSLYWCSVSLTGDALLSNLFVGEKKYLGEGLSQNIRKHKNDNPLPMVYYYGLCLKAFYMGRYDSVSFFVKSLLGFVYYGILSVRKNKY